MAEDDWRTFDEPRRIRKGFTRSTCAVATCSLVLESRKELRTGKQRRQKESIERAVLRAGAVVAMVGGPDGGLFVGIAKEKVERADDGDETEFGGVTLRFTFLMRLEAVVRNARSQAGEKSL